MSSIISFTKVVVGAVLPRMAWNNALLAQLHGSLWPTKEARRISCCDTILLCRQDDLRLRQEAKQWKWGRPISTLPRRNSWSAKASGAEMVVARRTPCQYGKKASVEITPHDCHRTSWRSFPTLLLIHSFWDSSRSFFLPLVSFIPHKIHPFSAHRFPPLALSFVLLCSL